MASIQAEWPPRETAGPTLASVCRKWSTIFASSGEETWRPIARRERNPQTHPQNRLRMERLSQRQLLSEAGVLVRGAPPPERVGVEEAPGVTVAAMSERELHANASEASPPHPVSAATTQVGLICVLSPRRRLLCHVGQRLAQSQRHDRCQSART